MRTLCQTRLFEKSLKKAHANERRAVEQAIRKIVAAPERGDLKTGKLSGVWTQTFGLHGGQFRLAYRFDSETIELISFGPRENFYR